MYFLLQSDQVNYSPVVHSDRYAAGHFIDSKQTKSIGSNFENLFNILISSSSLLNVLIFSNLFYLISLFLICLLFKKYELNHCKKNVFKILSLFYVFFNFFILLLISNCIKTEKVIVDVSGLIHSEETLMNTKRKACFLGMNKINFRFKLFQI